MANLPKEVVPTVTHVGVMQNADHPAWNAYVRAVRDVASGMGIEVTPAPVRGPTEIEPAVASLGAKPDGGIILLPSPLMTTNRNLIAALALRHRLPSIYVARFYPASGGLMSYGIDVPEQTRQLAGYMDRILKGAKPGELPVQAASKFEMVFNLKTAKALGITVPATMLGRADEVIE
jgi:putative tryptophan/tyrosine transport system substrate-binding protein